MKIELMSKTVDYTLTYKHVKNINMRIKNDGLFVSAPFGTNLSYIEQILKSRQKEIIKNMELISSYHTKEPFIEGKKLLYLGKDYTLNIILSDNNHVDILVDRIIVYTKKIDNAQAVYEKWLRENAQLIFSDSLKRVYPLIKKYIKAMPNLQIKKLTASWGRCTPLKNNIALSLWLIKADKDLIDYVMLHELCHYVHLDHSKNFYALLYSLMPDYKSRKKLLNSLHTGV